MLPAGNSAADLSFGGLLKVLFLLALAGVPVRMTILAMPPVIPLVHREPHMSETQVGLLVRLPLALFAIAAVPGSLLIARVGTTLGPLMLAAFIALMVTSSAAGIIGATAVVGFTGAMTFAPILALPALLSIHGDVPRTAAGMFTVGYSCAIVAPTVCGALWDTTGRPWTAFLPLCLCAVVLTILGALVTRYKPSTEGSGR
jgi:MFS transporter, CP family, cyanate transporter